MKSFQAQTHYEVLEVSVGASADEIRAAYERLTRLYGEEQVALYGLVDPARAQMLRERLRAALDVLLDEPRRDAYDASIGLPPRADAPLPPPATAASAVVSTGGWGAGVAWVTPAPSAPRAEPSGQVFAVAISAPSVGASTAMAPPSDSSAQASAQGIQAGPRAEAPPPQGPGPSPGPGAAAAPDDSERAPAAPAVADEAARAAAGVETTSTAREDGVGAATAGGASPAEAAEAPPAEPEKPAAPAASVPATQEAPVEARGDAPMSAADAPGPRGALLEPTIAPAAQVQDAGGPAAAPEGHPSPGTAGAAATEPPAAEAPAITQEVAAKAETARGTGELAPSEAETLPPTAAPQGAVGQAEPAPTTTQAQAGSPSAGEPSAPAPAEGAAPAEAQDVPRLSDDVEVAIVPARATPREYRAEPRPRPYEVPAGVEINGDLLKQVRMARGLTLAQLSERTRISVRHLENVETDRYELLPAPVYLRGILMNLARELGLDGLRVSKSYLAFVEAHRAKG